MNFSNKSTTHWKSILIDVQYRATRGLSHHSTYQEQSKTDTVDRSILQVNQTSRNCYKKKKYLAYEGKVCVDISPWINMRWERGGIQVLRVLVLAAWWWSRGWMVRRQYQWWLRLGHRDRCREASLLLTMGSKTERRRRWLYWGALDSGSPFWWTMMMSRRRIGRSHVVRSS